MTGLLSKVGSRHTKAIDEGGAVLGVAYHDLDKVEVRWWCTNVFDYHAKTWHRLVYAEMTDAVVQLVDDYVTVSWIDPDGGRPQVRFPPTEHFAALAPIIEGRLAVDNLAEQFARARADARAADRREAEELGQARAAAKSGSTVDWYRAGLLEHDRHRRRIILGALGIALSLLVAIAVLVAVSVDRPDGSVMKPVGSCKMSVDSLADRSETQSACFKQLS